MFRLDDYLRSPVREQPIRAMLAAMRSELPSAGPPEEAPPAVEPTLADVLKRVEGLSEEHIYICQILEEIYGVLGEILGHVERDDSQAKPAGPEQRRLWSAELDDSAESEQLAGEEKSATDS